MKTGLALFSLAAFSALLLVSIWASGQVGITPVLADLFHNPGGGSNPWLIATLFDANFGFLWFWLWAQYKERTTFARIAWLVVFLATGNMGMAVYMLITLYRLPKNATIDDVLLRRR